MNRPALRVLCLALALPLGGWFLASSMAPARTQDPKPAPARDDKGGERPRGEGRRGGGPGGRGPSLHGAMESMERELKVVIENIDDPAKREDVLASLGRALTGAAASQNGEPKNLAEIPAEKQAEHKLAFRRALTVLARDIAEIELLVIDGKTADAKAMFEKIGAQAESGHEKFGGDDH